MNNEYEIGYGKPPQEHKFKPGLTKNKKGRPKGSKNTYTLLNEILMHYYCYITLYIQLWSVHYIYLMPLSKSS